MRDKENNNKMIFIAPVIFERANSNSLLVNGKVHVLRGKIRLPSMGRHAAWERDRAVGTNSISAWIWKAESNGSVSEVSAWLKKLSAYCSLEIDGCVAQSRLTMRLSMSFVESLRKHSNVLQHTLATPQQAILENAPG